MRLFLFDLEVGEPQINTGQFYESLTNTISALSQRMIDDMSKLKPRTQVTYIRHVRTFSEYLGYSPDNATAEDLNFYSNSRRTIRTLTYCDFRNLVRSVVPFAMLPGDFNYCSVTDDFNHRSSAKISLGSRSYQYASTDIFNSA